MNAKHFDQQTLEKVNQLIKDFLRFNGYTAALQSFQLEESKMNQVDDKIPKLQKMLMNLTTAQVSPQKHLKNQQTKH